MSLELLSRIFARADWMDDAACRGMDPNLFFPGSKGTIGPAVAICADCPVREQCLQYAIDNGERRGVWGGVGGNIVHRTPNGRSTGYRSPLFAAKCGTPGGYNAHRRRGEDACVDCRAALAVKQRDARARKTAS